MNTYANTVDDFKVGQRVQLHPATDLWVRGARYGTVDRKTATKVHVRVDNLPGLNKVRAFKPEDLLDAS